MKKLIIISLVCGLLNAVAVDRPQQEKPQQEKPQIQKPNKPFPRHWGHPPEIQVKDMVKLPGKFGKGSSTLAKWISDNIKNDIKVDKPQSKPEIPIDVKQSMDLYKQAQTKLNQELYKKIKELGDKPSKEAVRTTIETFRVDNKDVIDAQKALGKLFHNWQSDNRPVRSEKPEPTKEVKEKLQQVREKQAELDVVKKEFTDKLKNSRELSKNERLELIKLFKQENADRHNAVKLAQKELQKEIRETKQDGDRRK